MTSLGLILVLLIVVLIVVELASRIGIPYPILLVIGGLLLALVPGLPEVTLEPDVVLLVFLPPLLYIAAYLTPLRDMRALVGPIASLSVGLVLFTTAVVGVVAYAAFGSLSWAAAFALGAIVAPTDALAASSIFRRLHTRRRIVTVLEGESLLNDAAALVLYRVAVVAAMTGAFVPAQAGVNFVVAAIGGVVVGLAIAGLFSLIYERLSNPPVEVGLSLVIPYAAFLPADRLGLSGVLAVVVAGLVLGRRASRLLSPDTRLLGGSTWQILSFLLNGFAFILVGLQLPLVGQGLADRPVPDLLAETAAVVLAVILARFAWVFAASYIPRWLIPSIARRTPFPRPAATLVVSWAGLRGAVSLAAALALPIDFPERNLILLVTFAVILVTLVGQGLTLPLLLRRFHLVADESEEREERLARSAATTAGLAEVARLRARWKDHAPLFDRLESGLRDRHSHQPTEDPDESAERRQERMEHERIEHDVITAQRAAVIELRDRGDINDDVLRRVERELDLQEVRMEA